MLARNEAAMLARNEAAMLARNEAAMLARSSDRRGTLLRTRASVRAVGECLRAVAKHDADLGALEHFVDVAFAELRVQH